MNNELRLYLFPSAHEDLHVLPASTDTVARLAVLREEQTLTRGWVN